MQGIRPLIDKINADEAKQAAETFRFMEEQKIKKALGPALWEDLKAKLEEFCTSTGKSSPSKLRFTTEGVYEVSIANERDGRTAFLEYNSDVPCVFYKTPTSKGQMTFRVSPDGNAVQFLINNIPHLLDQIATVIISQITGR
jgi:hypothetical protein